MTKTLHGWHPIRKHCEVSENSNSRNPLAIKHAAQSSVAIFDLSDRTQLEITGSERAQFLPGFTSNDIKRLKPGQGCETFITNLKGKAVAHVYVLCGETSLWLDGTPGQEQAITSHLGKFILIEDVQLNPRANDRGELYVAGPLAPQMLQWDDGPAAISCTTRGTAEEAFDVRRVDMLGQPGFLLSIPRARVEIVKRSMLSLGVLEGSSDDFENLRIAAGYPRYGVDMTDDNLCQEIARTKQCVSFNKGCYLGQETIARLDAIGHTNQELRRLIFTSQEVPPRGTKVLDGSGATEVGIVTSATRDLAGTDSVLAIGMMKRAACTANTPVKLIIGERVIDGQVL